jgi:hypothetical protein
VGCNRIADVKIVLNFFVARASLVYSRYDIHNATSPGCFFVPLSKISKIRAWPECVRVPLIRNRLHRFWRRCSRVISQAAYRAKSTGWEPLPRILCSKSDLFFTRVLISSWILYQQLLQSKNSQMTVVERTWSNIFFCSNSWS